MLKCSIQNEDIYSRLTIQILVWVGPVPPMNKGFQMKVTTYQPYLGWPPLYIIYKFF